MWPVNCLEKLRQPAVGMLAEHPTKWGIPNHDNRPRLRAFNSHHAIKTMKTPSALRLSTLLITLAASAMQSQAAVIADTLTGALPGFNPGYAWALSSSQWIASTFTVSSDVTLDSISVALAWATGITQPITLSLETDAAGVPSGTVLESFSFTAPGTSIADIYTAASVTNPLLTVGTYHLVGASVDPSGSLGWAVTGDNHTVPLVYSESGGASWAVGTYAEVAYQVSATAAAVPEPSALALVAVGLAFTGRRRR